MYCETCGAKIPDDSTFCEECGAKITKDAQAKEPEVKIVPKASAPSSAPPSEGAKPAGSAKTIIAAIGGVLAVAVVVIAVIMAKKSGIIGGKDHKADGQEAEVVSEAVQESAAQQVEETKPAAQPEETQKEPAAEKTDADSASAESKPVAGSKVPSISGPEQDVVIQDFDWYFNDGFPEDGTIYTELWGLGGMWKSLMLARTTTDGKDMSRVIISDTDVQYMGYKLTLLFNTKSRFEYPEDKRDQIQHIDDTQVTMTLNGDWDEERTSMDVYSVNSDLNCKINTFVTKNGFDYALGTLYNGDSEIGKVVMIRATP